MCGISLIIENVSIGNAASNAQDTKVSLEDIQTRLHRRGPDAMHTKTIQIGKSETPDPNPIRITFVASVLFIRGTQPTPQPYPGDDVGSLLLWNGEIFGGVEVKEKENDTSVLYHQLVSGTSVMDTLQQVQGPWAFIFWHSEQKRLWFARDPLGRRSLLVNNQKSSFLLSSMGSFPDVDNKLPTWEEVNTYAIFCVNFNTEDPHFPKLEIYPRQDGTVISDLGIGFTASAEDLEDDEENSNNNNNNNNKNNNNNNNDGENDTAETSKKPEPAQITYFPFGKRKLAESPPDTFVTSPEFPNRVETFKEILSESVRVRVANLPAPSLTHYGTDNLTNARLGILFSGGLDSMVLAALANLHLPEMESVDLVNVSFAESANSDFDKVPDRQNGINGLYELQKISKRPWNLIKVNITHAELENACKNNVYYLTYPAITIMDITIGAALWFAAKGKGIIHDSPTPNVIFTSSAKVLVLGMGADEQLAGYGRHRSAFQRGKWQVLQQELEKDFNRIWKRNLGRDDRIVSDSGREARFPYLDENVVRHLNSLPLWDICNLGEAPGTGDKKLLREVGKQLGLGNSTKLVKRAIQFGSRVSRVLHKDKPNKAIQKCGKNNYSLD